MYLPKEPTRSWSELYDSIRPNHNLKLPDKYDTFAGWLIYAYFHKISPETTLKNSDEIELHNFLRELTEAYLKRMLNRKDDDFNKIVNYRFNTDNVFIIEEKCEAIQHLINKEELRHEDRLTLCQIYINLPEGAERLHQILSKQKNYRYSITQKNIEAAMLKKIRPPSCETLIKKRYCRGMCQ